MAEVEQDLVPEAAVQEVQHGVLDTADVQVDAACALDRLRRTIGGRRTHPIPLRRGLDDDVVADRIDVAQVVPARTGPLRHDVEVALVGLHAVTEVEIDGGPFGGPAERRFRLGGLVELARRPVDQFGQVDRQVLVRDRDRVAVVVEDDRDRLPPVALTGEQPVAQLRGDHPDAGAVGFEPLADRGLGVLDAQTVEERGVHGRTIADVGTVAGDGVVEADGRLHRTNDRQAELHREVPVAFVLGRHGHDGAGAVAHQDIVGDEHRDRLAVDRVRRVDTQIDARLLFVLLTVDVGHLLDACAVGRNGCGRGGGAGRPRRVDVVGVGVGDQGVDQRVLGCQHHVGGAEEGVGAGREDVDRGRRTRVTGGSIDRETDFGALRATDPVALHGLDRVRPVEQVEILEQAIGIGGDAHHPLL